MEYIVLGILVFGTLAMLAYGIIQTRNEKQVKARVSNLSQTAAALPSERQKQLNDSFTERVIIPFAQSVSEKVQIIVPLSGKSWIRQKLKQAGYQKSSYVKTFMGVHFLSTVLPLAFVTVLVLVTGTFSGVVALILYVLLGGMGFVFPLLWLMQQAGRRQDSIRKALPDFLDLLVICVEAGLGLDTAIAKICKIESVQTSEYLRNELIRYSKDIGFGKPRKEAMLDLAERTGVDDLNVIINALIQAYELGTGITQTLRIQSEGFRSKRLMRAEETANKMAVKMVLPIYLFFFPGIFIVILGPMCLYTFTRIMDVMHKVQH